MRRGIKCSVMNCHYNDNDRRMCGADEIEVCCMDEKESASSSESTCCRTFRPRARGR